MLHDSMHMLLLLALLWRVRRCTGQTSPCWYMLLWSHPAQNLFLFLLLWLCLCSQTNQAIIVSAYYDSEPRLLTVLHVLVLDSEVDVDVMIGSVDVVVAVAVAVVVVSSRQPHQPGVLHVSALVLVCVEDVGVDVVIGVVCVPSSNFQSRQSTQSTSSSTHVAALSYFW